ncbi:YidH family protein [Lutimaribacter marinistellae]|uniref:YidH family protein n=1 Tax=Lutimaribacter marinistellae TaxID=1820329 RepID=A0ABV7TIT2_9RHOB
MELDDEDIDPPRLSNNELAEGRTSLAFERSRLASDRTTMGYMRTAISLIGFGFSIPALFRVLTEVPGLENAPIERARFLGLFMLVLAVFMLSAAVLQQVVFLRRLARTAGTSFPMSVALFACMAVLALGLFVTVNVLMQIGPA